MLHVFEYNDISIFRITSFRWIFRYVIAASKFNSFYYSINTYFQKAFQKCCTNFLTRILFYITFATVRDDDEDDAKEEEGDNDDLLFIFSDYLLILLIFLDFTTKCKIVSTKI